MSQFVLGIGVGAALAFFLDPDRGGYRRSQARDRLAAFWRRGGRQLARNTRYAMAEVQGTGKRLMHPRPDNPNPDDNTLRDRVESEVFRDPTIPKGLLNLNVVDGVVVVRGQLERPDQINHIEAAIRAVAGVKGVLNLMHLPGTPAPSAL